MSHLLNLQDQRGEIKLDMIPRGTTARTHFVFDRKAAEGFRNKSSFDVGGKRVSLHSLHCISDWDFFSFSSLALKPPVLHVPFYW